MAPRVTSPTASGNVLAIDVDRMLRTQLARPAQAERHAVGDDHARPFARSQHDVKLAP
jgi:hypothetical protein